MIRTLLCILALLIDIYLVVSVIGLVLSFFFEAVRQPYWWGARGWVGIVVAFIIAYLLYPHCGFLRLPL